VLLWHLLRKLEVAGMRGNVGHLPLHLEVGAGQVLLRLYHAHVDVLLVGGGNLLLLLLEDFDLLCNSKLLHCRILSAFLIIQKDQRSTYSSGASSQTGCVDERYAGDGP
jgi:hypothetical protein